MQDAKEENEKEEEFKAVNDIFHMSFQPEPTKVQQPVEEEAWFNFDQAETRA